MVNQAQIARHNMIDGQLEPNAIQDAAIIAAMGMVPRERFVPAAFSGCAYADAGIPLGHGRYIISALALGHMLSEAAPKAGERVEVIAGNTGYSACVLAQFGCHVVLVEELRELADKARVVLAELGTRLVEVQTADVQSGYASGGPYNLILIDGAVDFITDQLFAQLAEGGRIVAIQRIAGRPGEASGLGQLTLWVKENGTIFPVVKDQLFAPVISAFVKHEEFNL